VAADLEVRDLEPLQVRHVDVGRDDLAARADLPSQPDGHRTAPGADLEAPPSRLHHGPSSARERIEDAFQEAQPLVLGLVAAIAASR
jgi:hypothetical protein